MTKFSHPSNTADGNGMSAADDEFLMVDYARNTTQEIAIRYSAEQRFKGKDMLSINSVNSSTRRTRSAKLPMSSAEPKPVSPSESVSVITEFASHKVTRSNNSHSNHNSNSAGANVFHIDLADQPDHALTQTLPTPRFKEPNVTVETRLSPTEYLRGDAPASPKAYPDWSIYATQSRRTGSSILSHASPQEYRPASVAGELYSRDPHPYPVHIRSPALSRLENDAKMAFDVNSDGGKPTSTPSWHVEAVTVSGPKLDRPRCESRSSGSNPSGGERNFLNRLAGVFYKRHSHDEAKNHSRDEPDRGSKPDPTSTTSPTPGQQPLISARSATKFRAPYVSRDRQKPEQSAHSHPPPPHDAGRVSSRLSSYEYSDLPSVISAEPPAKLSNTMSVPRPVVETYSTTLPDRPTGNNPGPSQTGLTGSIRRRGSATALTDIPRLPDNVATHTLRRQALPPATGGLDASLASHWALRNQSPSRLAVSVTSVTSPPPGANGSLRWRSPSAGSGRSSEYDATPRDAQVTTPDAASRDRDVELEELVQRYQRLRRSRVRRWWPFHSCFSVCIPRDIEGPSFMRTHSRSYPS